MKYFVVDAMGRPSVIVTVIVAEGRLFSTFLCGR